MNDPPILRDLRQLFPNTQPRQPRSTQTDDDLSSGATPSGGAVSHNDRSDVGGASSPPDAPGQATPAAADESVMPSPTAPATDTAVSAQNDTRLYMPRPERWTVGIQRDGIREYCHQQRPGDDHYHLLVLGELYLQRGHEKYCLNCALRLGLLTRDRFFWQKGESSIPDDRSAGPKTDAEAQ